MPIMASPAAIPSALEIGTMPLELATTGAGCCLAEPLVLPPLLLLLLRLPLGERCKIAVGLFVPAPRRLESSRLLRDRPRLRDCDGGRSCCWSCCCVGCDVCCCCFGFAWDCVVAGDWAFAGCSFVGVASAMIAAFCGAFSDWIRLRHQRELSVSTAIVSRQ
jgi:hypothetical protein